MRTRRRSGLQCPASRTGRAHKETGRAIAAGGRPSRKCPISSAQSVPAEVPSTPGRPDAPVEPICKLFLKAPAGLSNWRSWGRCIELRSSSILWRDSHVPLHRPEGLDDQHWRAVQAHETRLANASARSDRSAIVGASKELCEAVAAVVCSALAQTFNADDYGQKLSAAHAALDRRPGRGAATEGSVRNISQAVRTIAGELNSLRNEVGTGHGRPFVPVVTRETATVAESAALLWSQWALARLDEILRGQVAGLVAELERGGNWRRGMLKQRFEEVDLPTLHSEDQHRIGVAVAHRGSGGGTFVVSEAGIDPLRWTPEAWPPNYRSGVAAGLLLDGAGRIGIRRRFVDALAAIVAMMDHAEWEELARAAVAAPFALELATDITERREIAEAFDLLAVSLDEVQRQGWVLLADRLREGAQLSA